MANIFDTSETKPRTLWPVWAIVALTVVAVAAVAFVLSVRGQLAEPEPAPPPQPTSSPTPEAHLHTHDTGATRAAWTAANTFLNGWTSTNKETRTTVFKQTALEEIADGLADTSEDNIVTTPIAGIDVMSALPYSTEFLVWFADDPDPVWILLTSGHATESSPYDWRVADIERRPT